MIDLETARSPPVYNEGSTHFLGRAALSAVPCHMYRLWIPSFRDRRRSPQADQRRVGASLFQHGTPEDAITRQWYAAHTTGRWPLYHATRAGFFAIPHAASFPCHLRCLLCHTTCWPLHHPTPRHPNILMHPHLELLCNILTLSHAPKCSPIPLLYWILPRQATPPLAMSCPIHLIEHISFIALQQAKPTNCDALLQDFQTFGSAVTFLSAASSVTI